MHAHTIENWQHSHDFSVKNEKGEQRTQYVLILTAITMIVGNYSPHKKNAKNLKKDLTGFFETIFKIFKWPPNILLKPTTIHILCGLG